MIVNFFNRTKPINLVFLSILVFLFYIITMFFYNNGNFALSFFVKNGINLLFLFGSFQVFNFILSKNNLSKETDLGILFYVFLLGIFPTLFITNKIIVAHFFLLLSFRKIYSLRTEILPKQKLFDSGFWIGIATIFYPLSVLFMFLNIIAIFVFNKVNWRYVFIPILGCIVPIFLFFSYFFYIEEVSVFTKLVQLKINLNLGVYSTNKFLVPIIFISIFGFVSLFYVSARLGQEKVAFKSSWILHLFQGIIGLLIILLDNDKNGNAWVFIFFPLSLFFANYMTLIRKKWIKEIIVYLFIGLIIGTKFL